MSRLDEVIKKGLELNNAVERLKEETKTLNSITQEKRKAKREEIVNDLGKYVEIVKALNIDVIDFSTKTCMDYNELSRIMGIKLHIWKFNKQPVVQIDLGVYSSVMEGFYAEHSMGTALSGRHDERILNGFCDNWERIKNIIDETFTNEVERILQKRKEEAIRDRERAVRELTSIR